MLFSKGLTCIKTSGFPREVFLSEFSKRRHFEYSVGAKAGCSLLSVVNYKARIRKVEKQKKKSQTSLNLIPSINFLIFL